MNYFLIFISLLTTTLMAEEAINDFWRNQAVKPKNAQAAFRGFEQTPLLLIELIEKYEGTPKEVPFKAELEFWVLLQERRTLAEKEKALLTFIELKDEYTEKSQIYKERCVNLEAQLAESELFEKITGLFQKCQAQCNRIITLEEKLKYLDEWKQYVY